MASTTIGIGVFLILLGLAGYFGSGMVSLTALIPTVFGIALAVLGWLARDDSKRKLVMHIAVTVGLAGLVGAVIRPIRAFNAGASLNFAIVMQLTMAATLGVFVALCVRSFINARRAR
jgi:zinc transporter ZupT